MIKKIQAFLYALSGFIALVVLMIYDRIVKRIKQQKGL